jgi:hypothetical protein
MDKTEQYVEHYRREDAQVLRNMVKALDSGISVFLNTPEDWQRLEAAKRVLRERGR